MNTEEFYLSPVEPPHIVRHDTIGDSDQKDFESQQRGDEDERNSNDCG